MDSRVSIILFSQAYNAALRPLYERMLSHMAKCGCRIRIARHLYNELYNEGLIDETATEPLDAPVASGDAVAALSIGGDGTFLDAAKMVMGTDVPVLGINSGRLGFLSDVAQEKVTEAIDSLLSGNYRLDSLDVLSLYANNDRTPIGYAINEFAITKCDNSSMLTIQATVDGDYLTTYWADGLIVATPTGSTAYSMSVGGPIVYPSTPNFIITPIAPHNLSVRPLILPNSVVMQLRIEGRGSNVLISLDGRNHVMENGCQVRIAKAPFDVKVVHLSQHSFFATLRNKLMWGADTRN